jgi:hypothetical protein
MQGKINLDLRFCTSDNGFSFEELVVRLSDLFHKQGFSIVLELIVGLVQEVLVGRLKNDDYSPVSCCEGARFHLHDRRRRTVRCSLGPVRMNLWRVKCCGCGKKHTLLADFLQLGSYQTKTNELEQIVVEAACGTSYRRAVQDMGRDHVINIPHTTAHDWVMRTDCDEIELSPNVVGKDPLQILADGTGFKGEAKNGAARKGDLKVVMGVNPAGEVIPLGTYAGKSWKDISAEWKKNEMKLPDGSVLVSDGEPGLADAFAEYASEQQRCHWHIDRDLYHAFWQDGAGNKVSKPIRKALRGVLAIELPEEDFQQVGESEKDEIEERMENAESAVDKLISFLERKGYQAASNYLYNAKRGMFGYVRRWLKWGIICPRASSMIERVMRELGRRLKNIAYGWSDKGAQKMARIILKKFADAEEWQKYWKDKLKLGGNVVLSFGKFITHSPNLAASKP